jgi:riboflavin kinase/FMN adenylyltransferase
MTNTRTNTARDYNLKALVLTFFPHPRTVLHEGAEIMLINTLDEKIALLCDLGIDQIVIKTFTKSFSRLTALEFVKDVLIDKLHTKHIIIGYDHHFGRNRTANIDDLREYGQMLDFDVIEIPAQEVNEVTISSTKIRKALAEGQIKTANSYLGYHFMLTGKVVEGRGIGRDIGFPTANIQIAEDYKIIPKNGSYVIRSRIDETIIYGMMNIGTNPTVGGKSKSIEVHFFDFNRTLYDRIVRIELLKRLRDEFKFESVDALKHQLQLDRTNSLDFIEATYVE